MLIDPGYGAYGFAAEVDALEAAGPSPYPQISAIPTIRTARRG